VKKLHGWLSEDFGIYFTYYVQHFNPFPSLTDPNKQMFVNTTMLVAVTRNENLSEFKFESYSGFLPIGKYN